MKTEVPLKPEIINLDLLEKQAASQELLLRFQVRRPLNLWAIKLVVAEQVSNQKVKILGEMKCWAYGREKGLQLDTLKVRPLAKRGVSDLLWTAVMAWALEETPCRKARLLAIRDEDRNHLALLRYFNRRGFKEIREIGSAPMDLPLRMIWGGSGVLMGGKCTEVLKTSYLRWNKEIFSEKNRSAL